MSSELLQNSIQSRIDHLKAQFLAEADWEKRYERLLRLGKSLAPMDSALKTEQTRVRGCQSQVWMVATEQPKGRLALVADSDAAIVKGLVAVLVQVYNGATVEEILQTKPGFLAEMGFDTHLSPSRANGLRSMIALLYTRVFEMSRHSQSQ